MLMQIFKTLMLFSFLGGHQSDIVNKTTVKTSEKISIVRVIWINYCDQIVRPGLITQVELSLYTDVSSVSSDGVEPLTPAAPPSISISWLSISLGGGSGGGGVGLWGWVGPALIDIGGWTSATTVTYVGSTAGSGPGLAMGPGLTLTGGGRLVLVSYLVSGLALADGGELARAISSRNLVNSSSSNSLNLFKLDLSLVVFCSNMRDIRSHMSFQHWAIPVPQQSPVSLHLRHRIQHVMMSVTDVTVIIDINIGTRSQVSGGRTTTILRRGQLSTVCHVRLKCYNNFIVPVKYVSETFDINIFIINKTHTQRGVKWSSGGVSVVGGGHSGHSHSQHSANSQE